ncbi:MAG: hypothetical protein ACRCZD_19630 [Phycicoccus sp.]
MKHTTASLTAAAAAAFVVAAAATTPSAAAASSAAAENVPQSAGCPAHDVSAGPMSYEYRGQDRLEGGYVRGYYEYYNGRSTGQLVWCEVGG